jgi:polysaccharide biosynthesis protein PslH
MHVVARQGKLRVLVVIPDLPTPPFIGFHVRVLSVLEALSAHHDVVVVGSAPQGADLSDVRARCRSLAVTTSVQNTARLTDARLVRRAMSRCRSLILPLPTIRASYSRHIAALVEDQISQTPPDIVHLEGFYALPYASAEITSVAALHDVFSDYCRLARRAHPLRFCFAPLQRLAYRRTEHRWLSELDAVIAINDLDRRLLAANGIAAVTVPFAMRLPPLAPARSTNGVVRLLFVGTFETTTNRACVRFLERRIAPSLDRGRIPYVLTIAGRGAGPLSRPTTAARIVYVADPPDLDDFYDHADIALAPVAYGGGTKTKTLEAMSHALPVVGTPAAFSGIDGRAGTTYVECPLDAREITTAILDLAGDPQRRLSIGSAARKHIEARHTQTAVEAAITAVYSDLQVTAGHR